MKLRRVTTFACAALILACTQPATAVIILGPAGRDTNPPTGELADSGWDLQGNWNGFLGTPISPNHFITVDHVGGSVGETFTFQGENYTTVGTSTNPDSDMRIWEVDGTFPEFAPLYTDSDEVGQDVVVFGRGRDRGPAVTVDTQQKGWQWGEFSAGRPQSWGTNTVSDTPSADNPADDLLAFTFDAGAGDTEASLAEGDSGGGVFILDEGVWKLAGIARGASGPYRFTEDGTSFFAAIFDEGGLFIENEPDDWQLVTDQPDDVPGQSFASRISSHAAWINSVVVPEPSTTAGMITGFALMLARRKPKRSEPSAPTG